MQFPSTLIIFLGIPEGSQYTEEMTVQASNLQGGKLRRQCEANPKNCQHTGNSAPEGDSSSSGGGFELGGGATVWIGGFILFIALLPYLLPISALAPCMLGTL